MGNASSLFGGAVQRTGLLSNGKGRALVRSSVYTLAGGVFQLRATKSDVQSPLYTVHLDKATQSKLILQSPTYKAEPKKPSTKSPRYKIRSKKGEGLVF